jgi:hypothetical protein
MNKADTSSNERDEGILKAKGRFRILERRKEQKGGRGGTKTGARWHKTGSSPSPYQEQFLAAVPRAWISNEGFICCLALV